MTSGATTVSNRLSRAVSPSRGRCDQKRIHHRFPSHHDEEPATGSQQFREAVFQFGHGAGHGDGVESPVPAESESVPGAQLDIADVVAPEFRRGTRRELREDVHAHHPARQPGKARGDETAARTHLENVVGRTQFQRLQEPAFDAGHHHPLTMGQRDFRIGERQLPVAARHITFPADLPHGVEHALVQNFPRAKLLPQHLGACSLDIHGRGWSGGSHYPVSRYDTGARVRSLPIAYKQSPRSVFQRIIFRRFWRVPPPRPGGPGRL